MSMILLSPDGASGLSPRSPLPAQILERGTPQIVGHTYHADGEVSCVVWGATPYRIDPKQRPDFEFSLLLEGDVVLSDGDGVDTVVRAGDAFVLPPSSTYQLGQDRPVLKFALSYKPARPAASGSVFTPIRLGSLTAEGGVPERTLFEETTGRIRVVLKHLREDAPTAEIEAGKSLVHAIAGSVTLTGLQPKPPCSKPGRRRSSATTWPVGCTRLRPPGRWSTPFDPKHRRIGSPNVHSAA